MFEYQRVYIYISVYIYIHECIYTMSIYQILPMNGIPNISSILTVDTIQFKRTIHYECRFLARNVTDFYGPFSVAMLDYQRV